MNASGRRFLGRLAVGLAVVIVTGSLTAYGYYWNLQGNVERQDADALIGAGRPKKLNSALNILFLGSDTRAGANAGYGRGLRNKPPASDTMILLHLSPGGGRAMGVSFPRDLLVPIPACRRPDGTTSPPSASAMLNEAIGRGGPACTIKTIERLSHIKIDHFVQIDFVGFKKITSAVGGVPVCVPRDVNDPDSGLRLRKGRYRIEGEAALAYMRNRKGLGDGSDTQRIKRQQRFLASLADQVTSGGTLTSPARLNSLLNASTKSLTTDRELTTGRMLKIAQGVQGLTSGGIRFVTVPSGAYALDRNRVVLARPAADRFFTAIRTDRPVPGPAAKIPPERVRVRVLNASGVDGRAARVAARLRARGFRVAGVGTLPRPVSITQVRHGTDGAAHAATLAGAVPGARTAARAGAPGMVDLVIGTDFGGLRAERGEIPPQRGEIRATDDICAPTR